ncbi:caspase family protein [Mastigocoleus sp. MO_188.B34]|uniref:caspase family protein n=1 Tax=Mastigocoleus sp. MO_188.B34 TaxID=3036635 RepID=UPI002631353A|nr:caspase family protein [Mastigocoleus sp. MO_188.B34]MDJ0696608.1 caspase family protein [Mastigocoleus sp. MO_188.B34]
MANNWAIAIGINQYQFFQPLRCAQADAEGLKQALVEQGEFFAQQCLLITDTSPPIGEYSTEPSKENILLLLEEFAAKFWQPQDRLWFFFSGYGINYNGRDYLMPKEGDPLQVEETGIALRELMLFLRATQLEVLILLDINRAFGCQGHSLVTQEALCVAQEIELPIIISCQPEQFSHESSEIGYGFFSAVLLEGLRSGHTDTLGNLENYLKVRIPELCEDHFRPVQNPASFITFSERSILGVLPLARMSITSQLQTPQSQNVGSLTAENQKIRGQIQPILSNINGSSGQISQSFNSLNHNNLLQIDEDIREELSSFSLSPSYPATSDRSSSAIVRRDQGNTQEGKATGISLWTNLLMGSCIAVILGFSIGLIFLHYQKTWNRNDGSLVNNPKTEDSNFVQTLPNSSLSPIISASTTPVDLNTDPKKRKKALLDLEKIPLDPTKASDLSKAIAKVQQIKPESMDYKEAQDNIQIWSQMILEIAENSAQKQDYAKAIAATQFISENFPNYSQAQIAIERWREEAKQYISNQTLLDAANALIKTKQASTYNRAIEVAKKIPASEPGFKQAQKSINQWSQDILKIAYARAAKGNFKDAIAAANLVPPEETNTHNQAQAAIKKWQSKQ